MPEVAFEISLKRLEEIVETLEKGDLALDQSLALFEEGIRMSRLCAEKLDRAEKTVQKLIKAADGGFSLEPFDREEQE